MEKQKRNAGGAQEGMMTVEAVLCLVPFILAILGIISFINIYMVHSKVQFAMYQTANELSAYTYLYEALGLRSGDQALNQDMDTETEALDKTISDVTGFLGSFETLKDDASSLPQNQGDFDSVLDDLNKIKEEGSNVVGDIKGFIKDPKSLLRGVIYMAAENVEDGLKSLLLQLMAKGLMDGYLETNFLPADGQSADAWLQAYGVKDGLDGLDLSKSSMFSDSELKMIDIVVEYDIEVYFFKLFLKDPTIHMVQRAAVPGWLDGDGGSYNK